MAQTRKKKRTRSPRKYHRKPARPRHHNEIDNRSVSEIRADALERIAREMESLIVPAGAAARKGKPAMLRLVSRWVPHAALKELPEPAPKVTAGERRAIEEAITSRKWYNDAAERVVHLEYKYGERKPDDSKACIKALGQRKPTAAPTGQQSIPLSK